MWCGWFTRHGARPAIALCSLVVRAEGAVFPFCLALFGMFIARFWRALKNIIYSNSALICEGSCLGSLSVTSVFVCFGAFGPHTAGFPRKVFGTFWNLINESSFLFSEPVGMCVNGPRVGSF